jgi:hypothetical protein
MSVKGILFNTDMVQAILSGRKTVTRRKINRDIINNCDMDTDGTLLDYGNADGDFMIKYRAGGELPIDYDCEGETYYKLLKFAEDGWIPSIHMPREAARIWLKVTDVRVERLQYITEEQARMEGVLSPYHYADNDEYWEETKRNELLCDIAAFSALWDSTIKKTGIDIYGWNANPWVWVIEFERCDKPKEGE